MRNVAPALVGVFLTGLSAGTLASNACSNLSIKAAANVSVSDGSRFRIESLFHSADHASIRHYYEDRPEQVIAVEGPLGWMSAGGESAIGSEFHKLFALGHQYHAFLLHPHEVMADIQATESVDFQGKSHTATSGDYPYGGTVYLVHGESDNRPLGMVFDFGETVRVEVALFDWRELGDTELPFIAIIDDGERVFEYQYSSIEIEEQSPLWFFDALSAPAIDEVQVHRLHRKLLAAHCMGDADLMADLSAPTVVSANRGELHETANDDLRARFGSLFETLDYQAYTDLVSPIIEVSGETGWIAVNVRAAGVVNESGEPFDSQWAWIMTARKVEGTWLHTGNASNLSE